MKTKPSLWIVSGLLLGCGAYAFADAGLWELVTGADVAGVKALASDNLWLALGVCFLSGILTSFTPCVYPMIPITINIFGRAAQSSNEQNPSAFNRRTFGLAVVYVGGMCFTYSVMGLLAGMTGSLFGGVLQSPYMLALLTIVFLTLALGQLGLFKISLPASLQTKLSSMGTAENLPGIFMMGLFSGLIVSPCVGPVIAGILAFVFESSNALKGFLFFFSFSLGLGVLFLVIGGFSGVVNKLPRSGNWMARVNRTLAALMIIAAGYYGLLFYRQVSPRPSAPVANHLSPGKWHTDEAQALKIARERNLPLIVDFTAEWCAACHELEEQVFNHPEVNPILHRTFVPLRIDVTEDSEENQRLLMKYGVMGLPSVIFVDSHGKVLEEPRIHGLIPPEKFLTDIQRFIPKSE